MTAPHVETLERLCVAAAEKDDCPEVVLALTAAIALMRGQSEDEVLVALKRPEGYEDVHPELVAEDAIRPEWPSYRTITTPKDTADEQ